LNINAFSDDIFLLCTEHHTVSDYALNLGPTQYDTLQVEVLPRTVSLNDSRRLEPEIIAFI
jgi:hypothetical protein